MKKLLLSSFALLFGTVMYGQQDPQFSQSYFNRLFPNPAVAGSNDAICTSIFGRQQWVGFEGRPESYLLSAHAPFKALGLSHGVGLNVLSDRLGQENTLNVKVSYAYRHNLGPGVLSAGFAVGMIQKTIGNDWRSIDEFQRDPNIPDNGAQDLGFDMDFGVYYKIPKKLYVGLSVTHLNASNLNTEDSPINLPNAVPVAFNYKVARHIYFMAGYQTEIINSNWQIKPNVFIKSDAVSTTFDLGALMEYQERFWGGLSYRLQDAIFPMVGMSHTFSGNGVGGGTIKVGYSYDITTSQLRKHSSGSHEIFLNYCFTIQPKIKKQVHRTVRFL